MRYKLLVRHVIFVIIILLSSLLQEADSDSWTDLLNTIEADPCTGLSSTSLTKTQRDRQKKLADDQCKKFHELLKGSPEWEQNDCLNGEDPACADTYDSCMSTTLRHRCSLRVDGIHCRFRRMSIYRCVSSALKEHKKQQSEKAQERRAARGTQRAADPPSPPRPIPRHGPVPSTKSKSKKKTPPPPPRRQDSTGSTRPTSTSTSPWTPRAPPPPPWTPGGSTPVATTPRTGAPPPLIIPRTRGSAGTTPTGAGRPSPAPIQPPGGSGRTPSVSVVFDPNAASRRVTFSDERTGGGRGRGVLKKSHTFG